MAIVQKVPRKLEEVLGPEGTDQFVDFLNVSFNSQKEDVIQLVADKFERKLVEETSKLRLEMVNVKAELKSDIATQTRWILVAILSITVLLPFFTELIKNIFHS